MQSPARSIADHHAVACMIAGPGPRDSALFRTGTGAAFQEVSVRRRDALKGSRIDDLCKD
jgi:hypothetical protein